MTLSRPPPLLPQSLPPELAASPSLLSLWIEGNPLAASEAREGDEGGGATLCPLLLRRFLRCFRCVALPAPPLRSATLLAVSSSSYPSLLPPPPPLFQVARLLEGSAMSAALALDRDQLRGAAGAGLAARLTTSLRRAGV